MPLFERLLRTTEQASAGVRVRLRTTGAGAETRKAQHRDSGESDYMCCFFGPIGPGNEVVWMLPIGKGKPRVHVRKVDHAPMRGFGARRLLKSPVIENYEMFCLLERRGEEVW